MKIAILVFSPSGNTLQICKNLEEKLEKKNHKLQIMDITRKKEYFNNESIKEALLKEIKPHDILITASPVYEKHLEFYMKQVLSSIPKPDSIWGSAAIPLVTYGGISSGKALSEMFSILKKKKRNILGCLKIESSHIIHDKLTPRVNEFLPQERNIQLLDDIVSLIDNYDSNNFKQGNLKKQLKYHNFRESVLSTLLNEKMLHKHKYPAFIIQEDKCTSCLKCISECSVQRITNVNGRPQIQPERLCIHCFACEKACPSDAITFENGQEGWNLINRVYSKVSEENSFFRSKETPKSQLYSVK